jgi:ribosomal protein L37AE/L43A
MPAGRDKFQKGSHYCKTPTFGKRAGKVWVCKTCGAVYTCKEMRGRLVWLQTRNGRK